MSLQRAAILAAHLGKHKVGEKQTSPGLGEHIARTFSVARTVIMEALSSCPASMSNDAHVAASKKLLDAFQCACNGDFRAICDACEPDRDTAKNVSEMFISNWTTRGFSETTLRQMTHLVRHYAGHPQREAMEKNWRTGGPAQCRWHKLEGSLRLKVSQMPLEKDRRDEFVEEFVVYARFLWHERGRRMWRGNY